MKEFDCCSVCKNKAICYLFNNDMEEWIVCFNCKTKWLFGQNKSLLWKQMTKAELKWQNDKLLTMKEINV